MLVRPTVLLAIFWIVAGSGTISAQESNTDGPEANPGRPTVSTPATLTPVGYLQFETGTIGAWHSPEFSSQQGVIEVVKFSVSHRLEFLAASEPFVHSRVQGQGANATADLFLGLQGIVRHGEGASPTIAVSYFRRIYNGGAPDLHLVRPTVLVLFFAAARAEGVHSYAQVILNTYSAG